MRVVSSRPRNARKLNREQKRIAATGVLPLLVLPKVDFIHLLPYNCDMAKNDRLET